MRFAAEIPAGDGKDTQRAAFQRLVRVSVMSEADLIVSLFWLRLLLRLGALIGRVVGGGAGSMRAKTPGAAAPGHHAFLQLFKFFRGRFSCGQTCSPNPSSRERKDFNITVKPHSHSGKWE